MAIAHVMKCASDILVELKAIHPKRGIIRSIIWIILDQIAKIKIFQKHPTAPTDIGLRHRISITNLALCNIYIPRTDG